MNSLDDLLSDITAFAEVERTVLGSLLRQVAFPNVDAVPRTTRNHSHALVGFVTNRLCTGSNQRKPQSRQIGRGGPDLKGCKWGIGANYGDRSLSQLGVNHFEVRNARYVMPEMFQHVSRLGTLQADGGEFVARAFDRDIIHDDVL